MELKSELDMSNVPLGNLDELKDALKNLYLTPRWKSYQNKLDNKKKQLKNKVAKRRTQKRLTKHFNRK